MQLDWHSDIRVSGLVVATVQNHATGEFYKLFTHNDVVDSGLDLIVNLLTQQPNTVGITHLAVGEGASPTTHDMTSLEAEVFRGPITRAVKLDTGLAELTYFLQRAAANNSNLREIALFSNDIMYSRALLNAVVPKNSNISMILRWTSQIRPEVTE